MPHILAVSDTDPISHKTYYLIIDYAYYYSVPSRSDISLLGNRRSLPILKRINHAVWNEVSFVAEEASVQTFFGCIDDDVHIAFNREIFCLCGNGNLL